VPQGLARLLLHQKRPPLLSPSWRPREDGSFEVAAWRDGTSLGVAVVPASVGPGGNVNLN
jgi:hypothetical protein